MPDPSEYNCVPKHFEILGEISRGGMGIVYRARDRRDNRLLALKVVLDPSSLGDFERFRREVTMIREMNHPNIVKTTEYDIDGLHPYIALELVEGETLKNRIEKAVRLTGEVPDFAWIRRIFAQIAGALEHAHRHGILHRDLKPENILIRSGSGEPVIIDFGLGKRLDSTSVKDGEGLTQTGMVLGTPAFMSPEQIDEKAYGTVSKAVDVWGFGATLYYCLTGVRPYSGESIVNLFRAILTEVPPKASDLNPKLPRTLCEICSACMNRDQASRPSAGEIFDRLDAVSEEGVGGSKLKGPALVLILLLMLTVAGMGFLIHLLEQDNADGVGLKVNITAGAGEVIDPIYQLTVHCNDPNAQFFLMGGTKVALRKSPGVSGGVDFEATVRLNSEQNELKVRVFNSDGESRQLIHRVYWRQRLRVSKNGQGDFKSLKAALKLAPKSAMLLVDGGVYRERLTLSRDIEIICDTKSPAILLSKHGSPLQMDKGKVLLKGFEIVCEAKVGKKSPSFELRGGQLNLIDCKFRSRWGPAVAVEGGEHTFENCAMSNSLLGLKLRRATVSLRNCQIEKNLEDGIEVSGAKSDLYLFQCKILENSRRGLMSFGGTIELQSCELSNNKGFGIEVQKTELNVTECQIKKSTTGIGIWSSTARIVHSSIVDCSESGISIVTKSKVSVSDVRSCGNGHSGFSINGGAEAILRRCVFNENRDFGISMASSGTRVEVSETDCSLNEKGGLRGRLGCRLDAKAVTFRNNSGLGIELKGKGTEAQLQGPKFKGNKMGQTRVYGGATLKRR